MWRIFQSISVNGRPDEIKHSAVAVKLTRAEKEGQNEVETHSKVWDGGNSKRKKLKTKLLSFCHLSLSLSPRSIQTLEERLTLAAVEESSQVRCIHIKDRRVGEQRNRRCPHPTESGSSAEKATSYQTADNSISLSRAGWDDRSREKEDGDRNDGAGTELCPAKIATTHKAKKKKKYVWAQQPQLWLCWVQVLFYFNHRTRPIECFSFSALYIFPSFTREALRMFVQLV